MNNNGKNPADDRLGTRLSLLRPLVPPAGETPGAEEELLRRLRQRCLRKSALASLFQGTLGSYLEPLTILALLVLLGLDLLRIIRHLLG